MGSLYLRTSCYNVIGGMVSKCPMAVAIEVVKTCVIGGSKDGILITPNRLGQIGKLKPSLVEKKSMGDESSFWLLVRPRRLCFLDRRI